MKQEKCKKMFSKDDGILYYLLMSQCYEALSSSLSGDKYRFFDTANLAESKIPTYNGKRSLKNMKSEAHSQK